MREDCEGYLTGSDTNRISCELGEAGCLIIGFAEALAALAGEVEVTTSHKLLNFFWAPETSTRPTQRWLRHLEIRADSEMMRVSVAAESLVIEGGPIPLATFARNIAQLASDKTARRGIHLHQEYYEGHSFIRRDSEPVVVSLALDLDAWA